MHVITLSPVGSGDCRAADPRPRRTVAAPALGVERQLLTSAARSTIQLLLIGLVLKVLFDNVHLLWVALMAGVMISVAGREVMVRQKRRFIGWWGFGVGTLSMFISSFTVTVMALVLVIGTSPGMRRNTPSRCWA
jgi:ABC-type iron transport system FetAB permease component